MILILCAKNLALPKWQKKSAWKLGNMAKICKMATKKLMFAKMIKNPWNWQKNMLKNPKGKYISGLKIRVDPPVFNTKWPYKVWTSISEQTVQVNLCQKHLFLQQLTHNMSKDCSLNYEFSTWKLQAQNMLCTQIVLFFFVCFCIDIQNNLCTQHVLSL